MHELSIAMSILDIAAEEAEKRGGPKVTAVHLKLGPLSGVVKEALVFAYELAREDSPLADAHLVIEDVPLRMDCAVCGRECEIVSVQDFRCVCCGSPANDVVSGRELEITGLEIEE